MKVGVLIPTRGDRPEFLQRAKYYLLRQTRQADRVLIFDEPPKSAAPDITYRYRKGCQQLFAEGCDVVLFMEDDDYYSRHYIKEMVNTWEKAGCPILFGIKKTFYYNILTQQFLEMETTGRASMMSMCASPKVMPFFDNISDANPFTDLALSKECRVVTSNVCGPNAEWLAVGIKHGAGLCGGSAHSANFWKHKQGQDVGFKVLKTMIGDEDAAYYIKLSQHLKFGVKGKIKLAIVSAVWKRPEVFEMFAAGVHKLERTCDMDITVIIAGSEGKRSQSMVERHGFKYVEVPNEPLATKVNAPMLIARHLKIDYVLCVGSDDIVSPGLMKVYESYMRAGIDYIGVTDFYFYDLTTKRAAYWGGYTDKRKGHTAGAGRLISNRLLNSWNWQPWEIRHSKVLDQSMQEKLLHTPHTAATFSLKDKGVFALDIKSETNMTPFQLWDNTTFIPSEELKAEFPFVIK